MNSPIFTFLDSSRWVISSLPQCLPAPLTNLFVDNDLRSSWYEKERINRAKLSHTGIGSFQSEEERHAGNAAIMTIGFYYDPEHPHVREEEVNIPKREQRERHRDREDGEENEGVDEESDEDETTLLKTTTLSSSSSSLKQGSNASAPRSTNHATTRSATKLIKLPHTVYAHILRHLPLDDLLRCGRTCRLYYSIAQREDVLPIETILVIHRRNDIQLAVRSPILCQIKSIQLGGGSRGDDRKYLTKNEIENENDPSSLTVHPTVPLNDAAHAGESPQQPPSPSAPNRDVLVTVDTTISFTSPPPISVADHISPDENDDRQLEHGLLAQPSAAAAVVIKPSNDHADVSATSLEAVRIDLRCMQSTTNGSENDHEMVELIDVKKINAPIDDQLIAPEATSSPLLSTSSSSFSSSSSSHQPFIVSNNLLYSLNFFSHLRRLRVIYTPTSSSSQQSLIQHSHHDHRTMSTEDGSDIDIDIDIDDARLDPIVIAEVYTELPLHTLELILPPHSPLDDNINVSTELRSYTSWLGGVRRLSHLEYLRWEFRLTPEMVEYGSSLQSPSAVSESVPLPSSSSSFNHPIHDSIEGEDDPGSPIMKRFDLSVLEGCASLRRIDLVWPSATSSSIPTFQSTHSSPSPSISHAQSSAANRLTHALLQLRPDIAVTHLSNSNQPLAYKDSHV